MVDAQAEARLWAYITHLGTGERCWLWTGPLAHATPVLRLQRGGPPRSVRRYLYATQRQDGRPVPAHLHVVRVCAEARCVNPFHARLGPRGHD